MISLMHMHSALSQPSILIVEDEAGPREALRTVLSPYFNLFTVDRAEVALQIMEQQPIDLITLDLKLPGQQGLDLLSELRRKGRDVEVIVITGYGTLQSAIEAIRQGISAYILKPFNVTELLDVINRTLERRQQLRSLHEALQAFGNLWLTQDDKRSTIHNIETLLGAKRPELIQHTSRVNFYASLLAEHLGLPASEREAIQLGAYLHDIGWIGIQERVVIDQSPSLHPEHELERCHPIIGERMMSGLPFPPQVYQIIRHHHEHFDGSGYPDALRGDRIPLCVRIITLADVFDNLVTGRHGTSPVPVPEARERMRQDAGTRFDPELADLFAKVVR